MEKKVVDAAKDAETIFIAEVRKSVKKLLDTSFSEVAMVGETTEEYLKRCSEDKKLSDRERLEFLIRWDSYSAVSDVSKVMTAPEMLSNVIMALHSNQDLVANGVKKMGLK